MRDNFTHKYKDTDTRMNVRLDKNSRAFLKVLAKYDNKTQKDYLAELLTKDLLTKYNLVKNNMLLLKMFDESRTKCDIMDDKVDPKLIIKEIMELLTYASKYDINLLREFHKVMKYKYEVVKSLNDDIAKGENDRMTNFL